MFLSSFSSDIVIPSFTGRAAIGFAALLDPYVDGELPPDGKLLLERQWTEERTYQKVDTKALKDLTGVLKDLTGLVRDLYGIPTQAQAEAQRIAAERLELDRKKAEDGSTDTHAELEIVGLPEEYKR